MNSTVVNKDEYNLLVIDDEIEVTKSLVRQFRRKYNVFTCLNIKR